MKIVRADESHLEAWLKLRIALWPDEAANLANELPAMLQDPVLLNLIALTEAGEAIGFAEAALRRDYVNGCETSPVVFLEGIYVAPTHRRKGIARSLTDEVAMWARALGCREFASDALLENGDSHRMHKALGFDETERVVYFRKTL